MTRLHVEPDELYLASRLFWQANTRGFDQLFHLRVALLHLEMSWVSDTAEEFLEDMRPILAQLNERIEELLSMGLTLSRQAEKWDESDQRWSGIYRDGLTRTVGDGS